MRKIIGSVLSIAALVGFQAAIQGSAIAAINQTVKVRCFYSNPHNSAKNIEELCNVSWAFSPENVAANTWRTSYYVQWHDGVVTSIDIASDGSVTVDGVSAEALPKECGIQTFRVNGNSIKFFYDPEAKSKFCVFAGDD